MRNYCITDIFGFDSTERYRADGEVKSKKRARLVNKDTELNK